MFKVALLSLSHKKIKSREVVIFRTSTFFFCMFVLLYSVIIISKLGCEGLGCRVLLCYVL